MSFNTTFKLFSMWGGKFEPKLDSTVKYELKDVELIVWSVKDTETEMSIFSEVGDFMVRNWNVTGSGSLRPTMFLGGPAFVATLTLRSMTAYNPHTEEDGRVTVKEEVLTTEDDWKNLLLFLVDPDISHTFLDKFTIAPGTNFHGGIGLDVATYDTPITF